MPQGAAADGASVSVRMRHSTARADGTVAIRCSHLSSAVTSASCSGSRVATSLPDSSSSSIPVIVCRGEAWVHENKALCLRDSWNKLLQA